MKALLVASVLAAAAASLPAQGQNYKPVTTEMLENPSPDDWLMYSRTYDAQRFTPLKQINQKNVSQLRMAWSRGFSAGAATARTKTIAIYQDLVLYTAPDSYVVGLDARTGEQRWQTKTDDRGHTSGPIVIDGKVISGGACAGKRENCYIAAHDARTGKELWRFYTTPAPGEPGDESWGGAPLEKRMASTWGLPGTYDPARNLTYWGIANPMPDQRMLRHDGSPEAVSRSAPSDLYSNSTVALDPNTGKLAWYYQHLPRATWGSS